MTYKSNSNVFIKSTNLCPRQRWVGHLEYHNKTTRV